LSNLGPYRRALCARRDLSIRRRLCKVEKVTLLWSFVPMESVPLELFLLQTENLWPITPSRDVLKWAFFRDSMKWSRDGSLANRMSRFFVYVYDFCLYMYM
jgi:hypothetical protein